MLEEVEAQHASRRHALPASVLPHSLPAGEVLLDPLLQLRVEQEEGVDLRELLREGVVDFGAEEAVLLGYRAAHGFTSGC